MNAENKNHGNYKHGLTDQKLYAVWYSMKKRCNPNCSRNEYWTERGISVCEEWHEFLPFYNWAIKNGYKEGLTFDRIDNNGNYCPENCRFTTWSVQNSNKRKPQRMPR